jgi:tripartite-type tricarboxylate transporter receptor subunit TctC
MRAQLRFLCLALTAAVAAACPVAAQSQAYPHKPLRWIVPFPPGGPADILARIVAERLAENLGQQVLIDNRAGASGIIGTEIAVNAPPDGYTLVTGIASTITTNQLLNKMNYDPVKDLAPVSLLTRGFLVLVVRPAFPAKTLPEFVEQARAQPGKLNYASWGNGSATHLAMELFKRRTGVELNHVPYKGTAPVLNDLMGGQIDVTFETTNPTIQYIRAGRIRPIGVSAPSRSPFLPEVPAIAETFPGFRVASWGAVLAPVATPKEIVARLSGEFAKIIRNPAMQARLRELGSEPVSSTPEELAQLIREDFELWSKVIKDTGIKAD